MNPWENEEFVREVYTQTKMRLRKEYRTDMTALFRVADYFEAYLEDADAISNILGINLQTKIGKVYMVRFPANELEVSINRLTEAGLGVCLSEIRDKNGTYYLDAYQEPSSATSDEEAYDGEYRQLISYKYKNKQD